MVVMMMTKLMIWTNAERNTGGGGSTTIVKDDVDEIKDHTTNYSTNLCYNFEI